jgi:hypothetical protein
MHRMSIPVLTADGAVCDLREPVRSALKFVGIESASLRSLDRDFDGQKRLDGGAPGGPKPAIRCADSDGILRTTPPQVVAGERAVVHSDVEKSQGMALENKNGWETIPVRSFPRTRQALPCGSAWRADRGGASSADSKKIVWRRLPRGVT